MKTLNECVVQEEHDGGEVPCPLRVPEEHLADIADVFSLRVTETEFPGGRKMSLEHLGERGRGRVDLPDDERGVKNERGLYHGQDETRDQAKHRVRVRERHDSQADVLGKEQSGSLDDESIRCWS